MAFLTALAIGASIAGSIAGGVLAKKGAEKQATAAERAQELAVAENRRQYEQNRTDLQPWMTAGTQAIQRLQFLLGLGVPPQQAAQAVEQQAPGTIAMLQSPRDDGGRGSRFDQLMELDGGGDGRGKFDGEDGGPDAGQFQPDVAGPTSPAGGGGQAGDFGSLMRDFSAGDFTKDPGYDFRLAEGAKALERSASARGAVQSGGTLKALTRYNQNFASNEFGAAYNRFQTNRATRYNQLAGIAGMGQTTAQQLAGVNTGISRDIANTTIAGMTSAAAARASGYSALGNMAQTIGNVPLNWLALSRMNANSAAQPGATSPYSSGSGGYG